MVTGKDIESARLAYVAALGTRQEQSKRKRLEWLVQEAKAQSKQRQL